MTTTSNIACELACQEKKTDRYCYTSVWGPCLVDQVVAPGETIALAANVAGAKSIVLSGTAKAFADVIRWILTQVETVVGWLLGIAATLFGVVVDPANISGPTGILNRPAVKDVWIMVRDTLNMFFILILFLKRVISISS